MKIVIEKRSCFLAIIPFALNLAFTFADGKFFMGYVLKVLQYPFHKTFFFLHNDSFAKRPTRRTSHSHKVPFSKRPIIVTNILIRNECIYELRK